MKLAVVDHVGNFGGASRALRGLLQGLAAARPGPHITYFGNPASLEREGQGEELRALGIEVAGLSSLRLGASGIAGIPGSAAALRLLQERVLRRLAGAPPLVTGSVRQELEQRLQGFDVAYFAWPYLLDCPRLGCPMVATFHDFNFKYYFGSHIYSRSQLAALEAQMPRWLESATPVVSSRFMVAELERFYPQAAGRAHVIYLAPTGTLAGIAREDCLRTVRTLGVPPRYALYPTNTCSHKNAGPLVAAIALLREAGVRLPLVLTGPETDTVAGRATAIGVERGARDVDVFGLGYVGNDQIDALIQCATIVVTSSLYEAGNGPGVDAWARGVPVAMSNIPPFVEHIEVQGVQAQVFDPRDPRDIAAKLRQILEDPERARDGAEASRRAMQRLTWGDCAAQYLRVFERAAGR